MRYGCMSYGTRGAEAWVWRRDDRRWHWAGAKSRRGCLLQVLLVQKRPLLHKAVETALARWRVVRYLSVKGRHIARRRVQGSVC